MFSIDEEESKNQVLKMKGNEVFKVAVRTIAKDAQDILAHNNMSALDLDYFVPHKTNLRIIQSVTNS